MPTELQVVEEKFMTSKHFGISEHEVKGLILKLLNDNNSRSLDDLNVSLGTKSAVYYVLSEMMGSQNGDLNDTEERIPPFMDEKD